MQKVIVEAGSKNTNIDICYKEEAKHILSLPIEFEEHYKKDGKLSKEDVNKLVERVNILNIVYYDIDIYGTGIFRELKEEDKKEFLKEFKEKTRREFNILSENEEKELKEKSVEYLANKEN